MIDLKILSYHSAQRYALCQTVISARRAFNQEYPQIEVSITELKDWFTIEKYTPILSAPSLVVNESLVCAGRFSSCDEVIDWLRNALSE
jgi:hypothetical protein